VVVVVVLLLLAHRFVTDVREDVTHARVREVARINVVKV